MGHGCHIIFVMSQKSVGFSLTFSLEFRIIKENSCVSMVRRSAVELKKGMGCKAPHETVL